MERAAFLIESSGTRIGCLLNPSSVEIKRLAGVRRRSAASGPITGTGLSDDPVLFTRGGSTELNLELLFDVTLAGSDLETTDVRALTGPLWDLAENPQNGDSKPQPPLVRFIWGKQWNIAGVITAIAQRLEYFSEDGSPRRSWVSLRMLRVSEPAAAPEVTRIPAGAMEIPEITPLNSPPETSVETVGGSSESTVEVEEESPENQSGVRLDEIANDQFGDPAAWRLIALYNGIADPLRMAAGTILRIPDITGKTS